MAAEGCDRIVSISKRASSIWILHDVSHFCANPSGRAAPRSYHQFWFHEQVETAKLVNQDHCLGRPRYAPDAAAYHHLLWPRFVV